MLLSFYRHVFPWQDEIGEEVKKHEEEIQLFHETYDNIVAEDKVSQLKKKNTNIIQVAKKLCTT